MTPIARSSRGPACDHTATGEGASAAQSVAGNAKQKEVRSHRQLRQSATGLQQEQQRCTCQRCAQVLAAVAQVQSKLRHLSPAMVAADADAGGWAPCILHCSGPPYCNNSFSSVAGPSATAQASTHSLVEEMLVAAGHALAHRLELHRGVPVVSGRHAAGVSSEPAAAGSSMGHRTASRISGAEGRGG